MDTAQIADRIISSDPRLSRILVRLHEATGSDLDPSLDDVLLRLFQAQSLTQYLDDSHVDGNTCELIFLELPLKVVPSVKTLIGDPEGTEAYTFEKEGRRMTGFKFDLNKVKEILQKQVDLNKEGFSAQ